MIESRHVSLLIKMQFGSWQNEKKKDVFHRLWKSPKMSHLKCFRHYRKIKQMYFHSNRNFELFHRKKIGRNRTKSEKSYIHAILPLFFCYNFPFISWNRKQCCKRWYGINPLVFHNFSLVFPLFLLPFMTQFTVFLHLQLPRAFFLYSTGCARQK